MSAVSEGETETVVVIGGDDLSDEVARAVESAGGSIERLPRPDSDELRRCLDACEAGSIAVVGRDDSFVLRMALLVRSVTEDVPLLLTIFDDATSRHVAANVPNTRVTSLADIVGSLACRPLHRPARARPP